MSKIDLEISIRSSDLVFARINLDFCGSDLFYTRFTLKERKEKVPSILEIWAEGLITCWALLPSGTLINIALEKSTNL